MEMGWKCAALPHGREQCYVNSQSCVEISTLHDQVKTVFSIQRGKLPEGLTFSIEK